MGSFALTTTPIIKQPPDRNAVKAKEEAGTPEFVIGRSVLDRLTQPIHLDLYCLVR
jgi:hypothetical protein